MWPAKLNFCALGAPSILPMFTYRWPNAVFRILFVLNFIVHNKTTLNMTLTVTVSFQKECFGHSSIIGSKPLLTTKTKELFITLLKKPN